MSQRELYEEFYAQFQASRTALTARLEAAKTSPNPDAAPELSIEAAKLRKSLVDGTYLLPAYDQRQCEHQMTVIEKLLEEIRASAAPKPRFAFKRKANSNAGSSTSQPSQPVSKPASGPASSSSRPEPPQSTNLTLSGHRHQYLSFKSLPPTSATTSSSDLAIADLDHCIVNLCTSASHDYTKDSNAFPNNVSLTALQIRDIRDSILILPLVKGSVMLHNLTGCIIAVGCHQFRMHNSTNIDVYLSIQSNPVIEHCSAIRFAPYPPSLLPSPTAAPTGKDLAVHDFSHIRPTPSPNWSLLTDGPRIEDWRALISASVASVDDALRRHLPDLAV